TALYNIGFVKREAGRQIINAEKLELPVNVLITAIASEKDRTEKRVEIRGLCERDMAFKTFFGFIFRIETILRDNLTSLRRALPFEHELRVARRICPLHLDVVPLIGSRRESGRVRSGRCLVDDRRRQIVDPKLSAVVL